MKFSLPSDVFVASQLTTRNILSKSSNNEIRELYRLTKQKFIKHDAIIEQDNPKNPKDRLKNATIEKIINNLEGLKEQNVIISNISHQCSSSQITQWQAVCDSMPKNIYVFLRKAIIFTLANNSNLFKWKKVPSAACPLCSSNNQTQVHMLNNCPIALQTGRYTWRHNSILFTMCHYLSQLQANGYRLYSDLEGFKNPAELFRSLRPDIVLLKESDLIAIELTCCFETNFEKSKIYKINQYKNLQENCMLPVKVRKIFVEISSLGFMSKNIKAFKTFIEGHNAINTKRMLNKMSEVAMRATYYIYTKRNSDWPNTEILKFY